MLPGADGWPDWEATKAHFARKKLFDPATEKWDAAWARYWKSGPGAAFRASQIMLSDALPRSALKKSP